ncbi:MAG: FHA domain-containing protein [Bacteriovoracaceae bacterium]|jgi:hypothetical protein|nr:FHA domain-containing protein [Bacteriovoracaceae bacterium]
MSIVLIISDREHTHKLTLKGGIYTLGRSSSCQVSLVDSMVSGKHLTLNLNDNNRVVVKDLHSSNGTFVNGSKVSESIISVDDEVTAGDVRIWIDESELTPTERNSHCRLTQKTKLRFVDLAKGQSETQDDIKQVVTNSEISISIKFKPTDLKEGSAPANDHPEVETLSNVEFKQQTRSIKISRDGTTHTNSISTKNDEKNKKSLGSKLKNLWKK